MRAHTLIIAFVSLVVMVVSHTQLDRVLKSNELAQRQSGFVPSPEAIHWFAGGFDKLIADIYWLAFIQYCGVVNERGAAYSKSYDYVNLITGLDPQFTKPYWFGSWAVGYWQKRPDLADKILQRGIVANPSAWDLCYLAGINQYLFAKNYKQAAHYYELASSRPGAPEFLARQAKILTSGLPELQKRYRTLLLMFENAKDPHLKESVFNELVGILKEEYARAKGNPLLQQSAENELKRLQNQYAESLEEES